MIRSALALWAALLASVSSAAAAREIVLTNDDGLTSNVVALYRALKAAGHDVIVSVPCQDQSGMGAAIRIGRPLGPLTEDCRNGAAKSGAPGAGPMTREGLGTDFFYVDGTPVMALLYGLDVAAAKRWGHAPDLVLSGPNEGQNLGAIIISSGTVGNVQAAALRGIPAIALSAGSNTAGSLAEPLANSTSSQVAAKAVELLNALGSSEEAPLLPAGTALNVNFPNQLEGAKWRRTKVGNWNAYRLRFVESMADDAPPLMQKMAEHRGVTLPDLPGVAIAMNESVPAPSEQNDESAANAKDITVSALQGGYGAAGSSEWLDTRLQSLTTPQRR